MKDFNKILLPVDLSESSAKLVPLAKKMLESFEVEINLFFVARILDYFTSIYVPHPSIDKIEDELVAGAEKRIAEFKEEHFADMPRVNAVVVKGDPAEAILKYVEDEGIDLIIMGTHGRKGLDRVMFGSVAGQVLHAASVPVLVVNPFKIKE